MTRPHRARSLILSLVLASSPLVAQDTAARPRFTAGLAVGAAQFDLSGTGTTPFARAHLDVRMAAPSWLLLQGAVGVLRPEEQSGVKRRHLIPEAQLQAEMSVWNVRPYLGVGGGWVVPSGGRTTGTASGAGGVRFDLGTRLDGSAELRVRGIGRGFSGSIAEWTVGAAYRF